MLPQEHLSSQHIEIKPLTEEDSEQFDEILRSHVWDRRTNQILDGEIDSIKRYMRGAQDGYGRTRTYLVAKDQTGKVLGCMAYSSPDPDMVKHFNLDDPNSAIELLNAFVSADVFRGGGVGKKLLHAICEAGKQQGKEYLLIHSGPRYQDSWGFYDKMTDEQCGFIENKYGEGKHAKTWKKKL